MTQQMAMGEAEMGDRMAFGLGRRHILNIVRDMSESIIVLGPDADIEFVNPATEKLLDFSRLELAGTSIGAIVADDTLDFFKALREIITKGPIKDYRLDYIAKDKRRIPVSINGSAMRDDETGKFSGIVVVARDMRDILGLIKRLEEANAGLDQRVKERTKELEKANADLKETQVQLLQKEKMASIGQLAAGVAHEINTPIAFVRSNFQTLSEYVDEFMGRFRMDIEIHEAIREGCTERALELLKEADERQKQADMEFMIKDIGHLVRESKDGIDRIKYIVTGLKDFAHPEESGMKEADINRCIENAVKICWHEIKYKADLHREFGALPLVLCEPQQLGQVFLNLIINALQAISGQGLINIKTMASGNNVIVEVRDNGGGIPEENMKKIFDPFFTTKPVGQGTGLGLSVVYGVIKKHKGAIEVESEVGKGTLFRITLPVRNEDAGSPAIGRVV